MITTVGGLGMRLLEEEARRQKMALERHWSAVERLATPEQRGRYIAGLSAIEQARLLQRIPQHQLRRVKTAIQQARQGGEK